MRRVVVIFVAFGRRTGHAHPHLDAAVRNYRLLLDAVGDDPASIEQKIESLLSE